VKKVAVVILNWNGKSWLEKFLPSIEQHTDHTDYEVIVADNGSTDDSILFLKNNHPQIGLIELDKNYGFTGGYNRALKLVKAKYFVLLNSDIEVSLNWLDILTTEMEKDENLGACQPKILAYNDKNSFEYAGASGGFIDKYGYPFCRGRVFFTTELDLKQYNEPLEIFWATGACLMVRAELYEKIGGLDEAFFAHMEEIDFCWHVQNLGYKIKVFPTSVVYHVGGGTLAQGNPRKTYLNFRNNLALLFKNLPFPNNILVVFQRLFLDGVAGIHALTKGDYKETIAIVKAHFSFYRWIPSLLKKRKLIPNKKKITEIQGGHSKSIVYQYFISKKKKFSEL
jgi:GT2 family glycosyltransferase